MEPQSDGDLSGVAKAALVLGVRLGERGWTGEELAALRARLADTEEVQAVLSGAQPRSPEDQGYGTVVIGHVVALTSSNTDGPAGPWKREELERALARAETAVRSFRAAHPDLFGETLEVGPWVVALNYAYAWVARGTAATREEAEAAGRPFHSGRTEGLINENYEEVVPGQSAHHRGVAGELVAKADVESVGVARLALGNEDETAEEGYFLLAGYLG